MNVITKNQIKISIKNSNELGDFDNSIKDVRKQFKEFLNTLNVSVKRVVLNHFDNRCEKHKEVPMLGEYLILLFGNLFSINTKVLEVNQYPWFLLYEYSLMLDDLLDKKTSNWQLELLSSQILLDKAIIEYSKMFNDDKLIFERYESYRKESINSMIYELIWSENNNLNPTNVAISIQGGKASLMKFGINCLFLQDKCRSLNNNEEKALDDLCSAIQLIDDLTDIDDDFNEGRLNVILQESQKWINNNYSNISFKNLSREQLLVSLIYSGSINNSLDVAAELINSSLNLCSINRDSTAYTYFKNVENSLLDTSKRLDKLLLENYRLKDNLLSKVFQNNIDENDNLNKTSETLLKYLHSFSEQLPKMSN